MTAVAMSPRRGRGKGKKTLVVITAILQILSHEHPKTVRAVCYQLFAMGLIPSMAKAQTDRIGRIVTEMREEGVLAWGWIVEDQRKVEVAPSWADPTDFMRCVIPQYRRDRWAHQPRRVELWSEKATLRVTLQPVLDEFGLPFRVLKGFTSATSVHDVAVETSDQWEPLLALYVGDFDPSGMYMSEADLPDRLTRYGANVELRRIALTEEDLGTVSTFPLVAKATDTRCLWFARNVGHVCAEIDALDPDILIARVRAAVVAEIDQPAWDAIAAEEAVEADFLNQWAARISWRDRKYPEPL